MIKTLLYGLFASLLSLSGFSVYAEENSASQDIYEGCVRIPHGWEEGDVARDKNTRLDTSAFTEHEGKRIRRIVYNTIDVFDEANPEENNRLYRFLNRLHFNTKPHVIKSQILFAEGDRIDRKIIQESARILRTRKYLTTAHIVVDAVCGDEIDVLVVTQDAWSLEPQVSFSRQADDSESGFALSDDNILGTGNSVAIGYEQTADRNAIQYSFSNPHFLNKPVAVKLSFAETSDGDNSSLYVARPFYSINTPWATGIQLDDISEVSVIRSGGKVVNEYRHQRVEQEVFFGLATEITEDFSRRWYIGLTKEEDSFFEIPETEMGIPQYRKAVYPWIGYQYLNNQFGVYKNVNQIQRAEDIALGINMDFRIGYGGTALDNADEMVRYKAKISNVIDMNDHIVEFSAQADGRQHTNSAKEDSSVIGGEVAYHYFLNDKNRWYFRMRYDVGQDLLQHEQLTTGDITGLRGYPTDYQRGNKRYLATVERRFFSDYHVFNLMRIGTVMFFDAGKSWGASDSGETPLLANVGFGLRLSSSKVRVGNVIHVDLAVPLVAKEGVDEYQLLLGAQQRF
jgi:outer membrane protein assembly factor BamA